MTEQTPEEFAEDATTGEVIARIGELYSEVVREMVAQAPELAKLEAKIEATKVVRRWYLMAVVGSAIISVTACLIVLGYFWSARTQQAAWHAIYQLRQSNFTAEKQQLEVLNNTLKAQGKPQVPIPQSPLEAPTAVSLATVLSQAQPTCPSGSHWKAVTFGGGLAGFGCVTSAR